MVQAALKFTCVLLNNAFSSQRVLQDQIATSDEEQAGSQSGGGKFQAHRVCLAMVGSISLACVSDVATLWLSMFLSYGLSPPCISVFHRIHFFTSQSLSQLQQHSYYWGEAITNGTAQEHVKQTLMQHNLCSGPQSWPPFFCIL